MTEKVTSLTPISGGRQPRVPDYSDKQMALIRRNNAPDATADEFDYFMQICRHTGLDPFKRQIHCLVFNKDDPEKRRIVYIIGVGGYRTIATRCGDYLPMRDAPEFKYDKSLKDPESNPAGLVECETVVYKIIPGSKEPWPVYGVARWEELAPLIYLKQRDKKVLAFGSKWRSAPKMLLAKCSEVDAIRRGWPDLLPSNVYEEVEMDQARAEESAWEQVQRAEEGERLEKLALSRNSISMDWGDPAAPLEEVEIGKMGDRIMAFLGKASPEEVKAWQDRNINGLKRYWSAAPNEYLEIKPKIEAAIDLIKSTRSSATADSSAVERKEAPMGGNTEEGQESRPAPASAQESTIPDPEKDPDGYARWWCERVQACDTPQEIGKFEIAEQLQFTRLDSERQKKATKFANEQIKKIGAT